MFGTRRPCSITAGIAPFYASVDCSYTKEMDKLNEGLRQTMTLIDQYAQAKLDRRKEEEKAIRDRRSSIQPILHTGMVQRSFLALLSNKRKESNNFSVNSESTTNPSKAGLMKNNFKIPKLDRDFAGFEESKGFEKHDVKRMSYRGGSIDTSALCSSFMSCTDSIDETEEFSKRNKTSRK